MKIDNLSLSFRNKIVLEDINIEIKPGEFVFFIWYSWSGKTSLIRSIIWDFTPERWDVILDNWTALYKGYNEQVLLNYRRNIWVIFQDYKLLESKKVYENVAFAMEVCGYNDEVIRKKVPEALEKVGLLIKKDKFVYELSGWEKQRVAIARCILKPGNLILADEPTGSLDPMMSEKVFSLIKNLRDKYGKTIIIVTHDMNLANKTDKIINLNF